jgi:colicin import membrane protein
MSMSMSSICEIIMSREMETMMMRVISSTVSECSKMYNFKEEEAMEKLGINLKIKKSEKGEKIEKKEKKEKVLKSKFPLPFDGKCDETKCQSLRQNHGLYTQCDNNKAGELYCKNCEKEASTNESGKPRYGTISDRLSTDIMNYTDPSGKKVVSYSRIMKKYKLTEDMVLMEAARMNKEVPSIHFEEEVVSRGRPKVEKEGNCVEKVEKKKGRPKSEKKVLELEGAQEDLFASLVAQAQTVEPVDEVLAEALVEQKEAQEAEKKALAEQKKEALEAEKKALAEQKKEALEAEKKAKKEALEAEKKAKKEALEAEKKAKKEALEAEKKALAEQKKEALEAEKKAKKEALELEKKAKKEALEAQAEQKKKAKKEALEAEKKAKKDKKPQEVKVEEVKVEEVKVEEEETDRVKKIEYEGKKYLKSTKTGIIYNMEQEEVGKWNSEKERIDFNEEEEEEEMDTVKKIVYEGKKYLKSTKTGVIYNMDQEIVGKWNADKETIEFQDEEEEEEEYDE